jgi:membrane-associated phospholipid phosphatase
MLRLLYYLFILTIVSNTFAQSSENQELNRTSNLALGIESVATISLFIPSLFLKPPQECKWCKPPDFDSTVRNWLKSDNPVAADQIGNILAYGVMPASALSMAMIPSIYHKSSRHAFENALIIFNCTLLTIDLTSYTKIIVDRERPATYYNNTSVTWLQTHPNEKFVSFFSGHTAVTFALASSLTTVGALRGYSWTPYIGIIGGTFATATGVLRVAADLHYLTDVITGALVGTGVGIGLPLLIHSRVESKSTSMYTSGSPSQIQIAGIF